MTTFKSLIHPETKEARIYITGLQRQNCRKVFVVAKAADSLGFEYDILAQIGDGLYSNRGHMVDKAARAIFKACQARVKTFSAIQSLAK